MSPRWRRRARDWVLIGHFVWWFVEDLFRPRPSSVYPAPPTRPRDP